MVHPQRIRIVNTVIAGLIALYVLGVTLPFRNEQLFILYFEKMDFQACYSYRVLDDPSGWIIILKMECYKIPGGPRLDVNIVELKIDDTPIPDSNYNCDKIIPGEITTSLPDTKTGLLIECGQTETITVYVSDEGVADGSNLSLNIKLHSKNGNDYGRIFTLYKSNIFPSIE